MGSAMKCVGSYGLKPQSWIDSGAISWSSVPELKILSQLLVGLGKNDGAPG